MVLALIIQAKGKRIAAASVPRCVWFRPQTFVALKKEARRNFKGAGEAGIGLCYFLPNMARFMVEWISIAGLIFFFLLKLPILFTIPLFVLLLLMGIWRLRNWIPHWLSIQKMGGAATLGHVALLDYTTRLSGVAGYWEGLRRGAEHCTQCRLKLRSCGQGWW
jgi:hypothetical protein